MATLNIKDLDIQLVAKVKSKAALEYRSIKNVVVELLEKYVSTPAGSQDLNAAHCPVNGPAIAEEDANMVKGKKK